MNLGEMRGQLGERRVPGNFLEIAGAARATELERIRQAIRVVEDLETGLASRAELAAVNRMLGIALELFRQAHLDDAGLAIGRTTSASPCITRTSVPQPAEQSVHTPGFQVAIPGTRSSSGMKRISWCSGLPQDSRAVSAPERAETLRKLRRSIFPDSGHDRLSLCPKLLHQ